MLLALASARIGPAAELSGGSGGGVAALSSARRELLGTTTTVNCVGAASGGQKCRKLKSNGQARCLHLWMCAQA